MPRVNHYDDFGHFTGSSVDARDDGPLIYGTPQKPKKEECDGIFGPLASLLFFGVMLLLGFLWLATLFPISAILVLSSIIFIAYVFRKIKSNIKREEKKNLEEIKRQQAKSSWVDPEENNPHLPLS